MRSSTTTTSTASRSSPASPRTRNSAPSSPPPAPMPSSSVLPTTPAAAGSTTSRPPPNFNLATRGRSGGPRQPHELPGPDHRHLRGHRESGERAGLVVRGRPQPVRRRFDNLAIGEPGASLNGKTDNGGVFVFQATSLPLTARREQRRPGPGAVAIHLRRCQQRRCGGFSVANAGDVNGATLGAGVNDLLIGAPASITMREPPTWFMAAPR